MTRPPAPLAGAGITLEPIRAEDADELDRLARDEGTRRFTRVPSEPRDGFGADWAARYVRGWADGSNAGFVIRGDDGAFLGMAAFVLLDGDGREAEAGYVVAADARRRGVASGALRVLTDWGFAELGLERIELRIDVVNPASERVAERCGYRREGVLRSVHVKDGVRADVGVWSRLRAD